MERSISHSASHGESQADSGCPAESLFPVVYEELRRIAQSELSRLPAGQTLQATALVHEVWVRLAERKPMLVENRAHFISLAARAIRHIVIDHARQKSAMKRGGDKLRIELGDVAISTDSRCEDLLALDEALGNLTVCSEISARIVHLRYFAGLTVDGIAELLGMSKRTVEREWEYARAWLQARIGADRQKMCSSRPHVTDC